MIEDKLYIARIYFEPVVFEVFNCKTKEDAQKKAVEIANDFEACCRSANCNISVDLVEVEEAR